MSGALGLGGGGLVAVTAGGGGTLGRWGYSVTATPVTHKPALRGE